MKNIHWLVPFKTNRNQEVLNSNLASFRLRSGLFTLPIFKNYKVIFSENINNADDLDYLFVGKIGTREDLIKLWVDYINLFREKNVDIFFDYTDHHLGQKNIMGNFYKKAIRSHDHIVTSSNKLKSHLIDSYKNIIVIEDPIEIDLQKITRNKNSTFLFYGHPTNLNFLFKLIPNWDKSKEYTLIIQTSEIGLKIIQEQSKFIQKPNNLNIQLQYWSISNMLKASKDASGVIIPGEINNDRKNGVSHNRLITAFALGLPVAATRYESYLEFDHQFVDIDNQSEFENFLKNPTLYSSRVTMAQKRVKNYTQENIAKKWLNLIR